MLYSMELLKTGDYALKEWTDAVQYITGCSWSFHDKEEAAGYDIITGRSDINVLTIYFGGKNHEIYICNAARKEFGRIHSVL